MRKITETETHRTGKYSRYLLIPRKWFRRYFGDVESAEMEIYTDGDALIVRPLRVVRE